MDEETGVARVAQLLADPARARIVWSLIDGTTRPAGELAYAANVSAQSASGHLAKLVAGGLLSAQAQGRHRYFRLASGDVAAVLEGLASLDAATRPRPPRAAAKPAGEPAEFLYARTCYGHLAGEVAVQVLESMLRNRWLAAEGRDFTLTRRGEEKISVLGIDLERAVASRRVFARGCVDLTQRRPHLGGALGEAMLWAFVARGWVLQRKRARVVTITPKGHEGLRRWLGAVGSET